MRMYDILLKKRNGETLTTQEIEYFISAYTSGEIPEYQASALLMAIWYRGMDARETADLTAAMARSGDMADLSAIPGIKVDKHSTGGVGDKTTLVVCPIVAACGVPVAKMSGRGLGFTGGTLDKLESIPGFCISLERQRFLDVVKETGFSLIGQTGNIAPADKKLYALRDVTATVDSLPLIASSIMSKKLASGADAIVLDVKTGSGAFMKTLDDSIALAQEMVSIGIRNGRKMTALITDMDRPLGYEIGNSLEVCEAVSTLKGHGPADLTCIGIELAANMLELAGYGSLKICRNLAKSKIDDGSAFQKLCHMVHAQGGDVSVLEDTGCFSTAPYSCDVCAPQDGWIAHLDTEVCGMAAMVLGAGRERKEDPIDHCAGITLLKKPGDAVCAGEAIARLHTSKQASLADAQARLLSALKLSDAAPEPRPFIYARVTEKGVERPYPYEEG